MANGKLNKKYAPLIWIALLLACFMRNAYAMYMTVVSSEISGSMLTVLLIILRFVFEYGALPLAIVAVGALIVWYIGSARYVRSISRSDFCYIVMATVAAEKFLVGIIEIFAILAPDLQTVTSSVLDFALLTAAFLAVYFLVIVKWYRFNPVEKYNAFKMWFMIYMIVAGVAVVGGNISVLALMDGSQISYMLYQMLITTGTVLYLGPVQMGASIAAIAIYFAYLIAVIVIGEVLRSRANKFRNPETRGEYYESFDNRGYTLREDADSVFGGENKHKKDDEHVFDEFDL